jgi:glycerol kinase
MEIWLRDRTGLQIDPYFSASKLRWILDQVPDAQAQAERGELAFGTLDSWLIWCLTSGQCHLTMPAMRHERCYSIFRLGIGTMSC